MHVVTKRSEGNSTSAMQTQTESVEMNDEDSDGAKEELVRSYGIFKDGSDARVMVQFSRWDVNRHMDMLKFNHEVVKRWGMGTNPIAAGPEIHEVIVPRRDMDGFQERNKYNQLKSYVNIRARFYVPQGAVDWFIQAVVDSGLLKRKIFGRQFYIEIELNRKDTEANQPT